MSEIERIREIADQLEQASWSWNLQRLADWSEELYAVADALEAEEKS
jgi:hypothetical protein